MEKSINPFDTLSTLSIGDKKFYYYSLKKLEEQKIGDIKRLPVSIRILLEALLRNCDNSLATEDDIRRLASWNPKKLPEGDFPFIVSRVLLQDFTGVPLLVDLAAMRDAVTALGLNPQIIEPLVPVDLVVDHSVQVDRAGTSDSFDFNLETEQRRNWERFSFLKWGQQAFNTFKAVPPGIGICHQVNLEHIASVVSSAPFDSENLLFPDTLVGTDSHTTMVNGLGVLGWGVGGIEAEAAMLGQPLSMQIPEVIGVDMSGHLSEGITATDLTLKITELLRKEKVVGKLVEFFGSGVEQLSVADRATIANMAPEYGATAGFFPVDEKTLDYLRLTGRSEEHIQQVKSYCEAQGFYGIPKSGQVDYTKILPLDLSTLQPCVAGPKRPQDRIDLPKLKERFQELLEATTESGGYNKKGQTPKVCVHSEGSFSVSPSHYTGGTNNLEENGVQPSWSESEMVTNRPIIPPPPDTDYLENGQCDIILTHGSVVIAAITSCTNTSNPDVMIAAGLLAKKAVEKGLKINCLVKTSLAPGSRVVTDYLEKVDLQRYLDALGFQLVAYGCTTCIGNSGPLEEQIEQAIKEHDLIVASVLSGNRNFEARINSAVKANFLMSPPLVIAFAIAGRVDIDMNKEPLGNDKEGNPVFLRDIWPTVKEIDETVGRAVQTHMFLERYANVLTENPLWEQIETSQGASYDWSPESTYIQNPPYFDGFTIDLKPQAHQFTGMRPLAFFGDSVTTEHISPAGSFKANSPAGQYLLSLGVKESDFNSYGSRRGNHNVMIRGTFANVRIRNMLAGGIEGGFTKLMPEGTVMSIFDACQIYKERNIPLIIFTGKDYGMGSSRDWAAKGAALLGVKVVIACSFERIHRSNLIGMGVLPLQFQGEDSWESLKIEGDETFSLIGLHHGLHPGQQVTLEIIKGDHTRQVPVLSRLDTASDVVYYENGGILPYVLRQILAKRQ
jgi:aconitate hydratase